jgi:hypothetical protein
MAWIKRNLVLVISGVIALALFGLGGFYLYSAIQKDRQISGEIESTKSEIQRLFAKDVTPTAENLKNAKQEAVKLNAFVSEAKRLFPASPPPSEPLNAPNFKSILARTVNGLHQQATSVGIKLDSNYYFTFESQRLPVAFPAESLRPLSERLHEVQFISEVLFKSRINRLVGIRRAMVANERPGVGNNPGGANDYLPTAARTNAETGMTVWPYEVTFESFTPELASVLEGMQSAKYGFIVRSLEIKPAEELARAPRQPRPPGPAGQQPPLQPGNRRPVPPGQPPPQRIPGAQPPGAVPAPAPAPAGATPVAAAAQPRPGLVTIINERLLRVTLRLDVIKPDTTPSGGGPGGPRRGGPQ